MAGTTGWSAEKRAEVRQLAETKPLSFAALSARTGVPQATIGFWCRTEGWERPACVHARPRIDPEKRPALRRVRLGVASAMDVALLLGCSEATARNEQRSWARLHDGERTQTDLVAAPLREMHEALCQGDLRRTELLMLLQRVAALVAAEALLRREPHIDRIALGVARMADRIAALPDEPGHTGVTSYDTRESDRTLGELRDELYRRLLALQAAAGSAPGVRGEPEPAGG